MVRERLPPRVQDHRHTDLGAEVLLVGGDRAQRLGRRLEQDGVDDHLVLIGDRPKRRWQREYDVEILNWQQIRLPRFEPFMRGAGLALRAVPVAAAVVGDLAVTAVAAALDVPAKRRRPARANRSHDLELAPAQMPGIDLAIGVAVAAENIRHLQRRP
jgi:hypothetical protein